MTPDPLDVLKYAYVLTHTLTESYDGLATLRDDLDWLMAPFIGPPDQVRLDDLRYSDGSFISVTTTAGAGQSFANLYLPPSFPTKASA